MAAEERQAVIRKEKGEYCVKSPNNPDWNGGCYPSKEKAKERLQQVEFFKRQAYSYDRRVALTVLDADERPYDMPADHVPGVFTPGAVKGCHTCEHSGSEAGNVTCNQPNYTAWNGSTTVTETPGGKPVKLDDGKWYCCDWWERASKT